MSDLAPRDSMLKEEASTRLEAQETGSRQRLKTQAQERGSRQRLKRQAQERGGLVWSAALGRAARRLLGLPGGLGCAPGVEAHPDPSEREARRAEGALSSPRRDATEAGRCRGGASQRQGAASPASQRAAWCSGTRSGPPGCTTPALATPL